MAVTLFESASLIFSLTLLSGVNSYKNPNPRAKGPLKVTALRGQFGSHESVRIPFGANLERVAVKSVLASEA